MNRSSPRLLEHIRQRVSLFDVVSAYTTVRNAGRSYLGPCPFHAELSPSFHVYPKDWISHCFGCRAHGDGFTIVMEQAGLTFNGAVALLARYAGIDPASDQYGDPAGNPRAD